MDKGIILFDIDRTILNTEALSTFLTESLMKVLKTSDFEKVRDIKLKYRRTLANNRYYLPEVALKLIAEEFNFKNINELLDVYYGKQFEFIYKDLVYPEFFEAIKKLKRNYIFGIYSEGTKKYQNHKFESMGIADYFDPNLIFIVEAKDTVEVLQELPKTAVIVDDKENICDFLTKNGFMAIWLNRENNKDDKRFRTIHSLLELPAIL